MGRFCIKLTRQAQWHARIATRNTKQLGKLVVHRSKWNACELGLYRKYLLVESFAPGLCFTAAGTAINTTLAGGYKCWMALSLAPNNSFGGVLERLTIKHAMLVVSCCDVTALPAWSMQDLWKWAANV